MIEASLNTLLIRQVLTIRSMWLLPRGEDALHADEYRDEGECDEVDERVGQAL